MTPAPVRTLTTDTVDLALAETSGLLVVDFWGYRCVPCARLLPVIDELAADYSGRVTFCTLNVHEHLETALRFQIKRIPTLLLFRGGQLVASTSGWQPKDDLRQLIDGHIP